MVGDVLGCVGAGAVWVCVGVVCVVVAVVLGVVV